MQHGIGYANLGEAGCSQDTAVTAAARSRRCRIVAAVGQAVVESELEPAPDDLRLGHHLQRGVNTEALTLDAARRGERRQPFEGGNELGTAIRVARVVED